MVADHLPPRRMPRFLHRDLVKVPGGTSALKYYTVDCTMIGHDGQTLRFSLPDTLGALTLKGGAYLNDTRDRNRRLQDGAVLLSTVQDPRSLRGRMQGSDAQRIAGLIDGLQQNAYLFERFDVAGRARIAAVSEELCRGRVAREADPIKIARNLHNSTGLLCGAPTRAGGPCRNPAGNCRAPRWPAPVNQPPKVH